MLLIFALPRSFLYIILWLGRPNVTKGRSYVLLLMLFFLRRPIAAKRCHVIGR